MSFQVPNYLKKKAVTSHRTPKIACLDPFFPTTVLFARIFLAVVLWDFGFRICGFAALGTREHDLHFAAA